MFLDGGFQLPASDMQRERMGIPAGVVIVQPPRLGKGCSYSAEAAELKQISDAIRSVIENVFAKLKEFVIVAERYPQACIELLPKVICVVCALVLFNMRDRDHFLRKK